MIPNTVPCTTVSAGFSPTAVIVYSLSEEALESQFGTVTFGYHQNKMINQLDEVFAECSSEGWDGYGAAPVTRKTFKNALSLIRCIPYYFPYPEIGADPDGHLNFEWYNDPRHLVSVSISPEGMMYYAALIGEKKIHDSEPFTGEIPKRIRDIIYEVV